MLIKEDDNKSIAKVLFPVGYNVQLNILGLGLCKLDFEYSQIRFIRHPAHHKLKLDVKRLKSTGEVLESVLSYYVDSDENININIDCDLHGLTYRYPTNNSKENLSYMLNLIDIHKKGLEPVANARATSQVTINKCQFYTAQLTNPEFIITYGNTVARTKDKLGIILGAYSKCRDSGYISITSEKLNKRIPQKIEGEDCYYRISFDNACDHPKDCVEDAGENDTDFRYYYDVIKEKGEVKQIKLFILDKDPKTAEVGACLPVVEDPPFNG